MLVAATPQRPQQEQQQREQARVTAVPLNDTAATQQPRRSLSGVPTKRRARLQVYVHPRARLVVHTTDPHDHKKKLRHRPPAPPRTTGPARIRPPPAPLSGKGGGVPRAADEGGGQK